MIQSFREWLECNPLSEEKNSDAIRDAKNFLAKNGFNVISPKASTANPPKDVIVTYGNIDGLKIWLSDLTIDPIEFRKKVEREIKSDVNVMFIPSVLNKTEKQLEKVAEKFILQAKSKPEEFISVKNGLKIRWHPLYKLSFIYNGKDKDLSRMKDYAYDKEQFLYQLARLGM